MHNTTISILFVYYLRNLPFPNQRGAPRVWQDLWTLVAKSRYWVTHNPSRSAVITCEMTTINMGQLTLCPVLKFWTGIFKKICSLRSFGWKIKKTKGPGNVGPCPHVPCMWGEEDRVVRIKAIREDVIYRDINWNN